MAQINNNNEIVTNKATAGQFVITYQQMGAGGIIPVIDGTEYPMLAAGYTSEADRDAYLRLLAEAWEATEGNVYETMRYMMNAVITSAKNIRPDDVAEVKGVEILISYSERKAYLYGEQIATLEDLNCPLPEDAIKTLLTERAAAAIVDRDSEVEVDYDFDDDDEDDDDCLNAFWF